MAETLTLREFIALVNGSQSNVELGVAWIFPLPGSTRGGTYVTCGDDEYPLGWGRGWDSLLDPFEQASIFRHFGHEDLLELFGLADP